MSVIDDVRREREDLARVLKKHAGIRRIVEDLHPDSAHFIYELLQNAEDAGATEARFMLTKTSLVFEHNGRPFEPRDIFAITDIGEGTKAEDDDKIGRFGVGFKAVFAYSETPHIWSPTFSFKISELVLPSELDPMPDIENRTRFEFPFNNPKKTPDIAFAEVEQGLRDLSETTLLFLTHLTSVAWHIGDREGGKILRVEHAKNHVEAIKQFEGKTTEASHFLRFDRPVQGLEKQRIAVAFALDFLPNVQQFDAEIALAKQLKIVPVSRGRVAVFFPAEKESSGLRFHLHAPFVPELSRASIKETPANLPLFEQLAVLTAESLHEIRDLDLLTADFLEVLPNNRDPIDERYQGIRDSIHDEMNDQPLTPTQSKSHAPAKHLLQGKASLKSLLSDEDLEFLVDYDDEPWKWAVGITQRNSNADRFLESLAIGEWDIDEFVTLLCNKTGLSRQTGPPMNVSSEDVMEWLRGKSAAWLQELYALLFVEHLMTAGYEKERCAANLGSLQLVRLTDETFGVGCDSFFVSDGVEHDEVLRRVAPAVYTCGKSKTQKENAKAFLQEVGVREVGEFELVEAILQRRYTHEAPIPDDKTYKKDLKRFIDLVETEPEAASIFADYFIFECTDLWRTPKGVYLDKPYLDTGLNAYYGALGEAANRGALSESYQNRGVSAKRLIKFALAVGATRSLEIRETTCRSNPNVHQLAYAAPGNWSRYGINSDYFIPELDDLLESPDVALAQLIWKTLCEQDNDSWTVARYRNNSSWPIRTSPSQLVYVLRNRAWIPQTDGRFVRPAEASRDALPAGFAFDPGWTWLEAIQFEQRRAEETEEQIQRQGLARQLGFSNEDALDRAQRFAALPPDEQLRMLQDWERQTPIELPDQEPKNPRRRAELVEAEAANAPERTTEERTRTVPVNRDAVKQEAGQYLLQQYTNSDGQMICQVCKNRLPFKLDDGSDYFECVEFLPELKRHHKQNYLALCPNHGAMFQHTNGSTDDLRDQVVQQTCNEIEIVLAKEDRTIYFTKTHLADLKAIIRADENQLDTTCSEVRTETETPFLPRNNH